MMIKSLKDFRVIILGMLVFVSVLSLSSKVWNVSAQSNKPTPVPLFLSEAYRLGLDVALNWNSSAKLYAMLSTDQGEDPDVPDVKRGLDGRRISWNLDFVIPETERHLLLEVRSGQVVNQTEVQGPHGDNFFEEKEVMAIQTADNLQIAKQQGLRPGRAWATGYHYRLFKDGKVPILVIRGDDDQGNQAIVSIDLEKKQVAEKQRKASDGSWQNY
ncbi:MAG: hypothetical protein HS114_01300 [Anaerolineales bacterium]|nr:hypothetical protein [Anaerolineales bacterium]